MRSPKDHAEFAVVREWVRGALGGLCEDGSVALEREKSVLKQGAVQHLYARLAGALPHRGHSEPAADRVVSPGGVSMRTTYEHLEPRVALSPCLPLWPQCCTMVGLVCSAVRLPEALRCCFYGVSVRLSPKSETLTPRATIYLLVPNCPVTGMLAHGAPDAALLAAPH